MAKTEITEFEICKLIIEYWRVLRAYERNLVNISNNSGAVATIRNSEKKFTAVLEKMGLRIVSCEGQEYSPNLPITVINSDDFTSNEGLYVVQMIEPTIMIEDKIINIGKVILSTKISEIL
jgi:hypothetical protein